MRMYLAKKECTYVPQNKLEEAIQNFIDGADRKLIADCDLENFKKEIIHGIEKLNKEFPRCKPIKPYFWTPEGFPLEPEKFTDWSLQDVRCIAFHILSSQAIEEESE